MNRATVIVMSFIRFAVVVHSLAVTLAFCADTQLCAATPSKDGELRTSIEALPVTDQQGVHSKTDYLIDPLPYKARLTRSADGRELMLENGLIRRTWRLSPNGACVAFDNLMTDQAMLRSVRPEARVSLNGKAYDVGGLTGQPNHAYLDASWLNDMKADPNALSFVGFETGEPKERLKWGRVRRAASNSIWPPKGRYLRMDYALPIETDDPIEASKQNESAESPRSSQFRGPQFRGPQFRVSVHYELYDGLPVMSKWVTVHNRGDNAITLDRYTSEELAVVEHSNPVETREGVPLPRPDYLHVETDFAFGGFHPTPANRHVVHWRADPSYKTQVNYLLQSPCLMVCEPTYGPAQKIEPGESFEGFHIFELVYDAGNRERRGLAYRRMYRTIAPWVTENPLTHHLLTNKAEAARKAIDKAAEVGFEAIIFSFGSGFNMETRDPEFLNEWSNVADYARSKNVELGSYSLLSSRGVAKKHMLVSPEGQKPTHGRMPALTSDWGQAWIQTIRDFYTATKFSQFENDGPFPGDIDVTPRPPLQQGINDSRWAQWRQNNRLYHGLRADGVYINQPDYHYLNGGNKSSMGYREVNWSLPRAQQVIHTRQNIYDGTWTKTPSMGWMHVPLAEYHGGGADATIEPLHQHIDHYRRMLLSNLGMGVQAHYRGPRIYDTDATREMVKASVDWFKRYRDILESDIVHGRRADGRDLDWILHANPELQNKGMLCVYNPLDRDVTKRLLVNVYYTGLRQKANVRVAGGVAKTYDIDRHGRIEIEVRIPANDMNWYVLQANAPQLINFSDKESIAARRPIVVAHRGGVVSPRSAECSLTAIRLAAAMGYDMVELDVRKSRDGTPIVFHDRSLAKACGKSGSVGDYTTVELEAIRYSLGNDRIVTLETAFAECRQLGLGVMLDLKDGRDSPKFLQSIEDQIVANGLTDAVISFSGSVQARRLLQHVRFTPTDEEMRKLRTGKKLDLSQRFWFGIPEWLEPMDLSRLKSAGALVIPAINTFRYPAEGHFGLAKKDIDRLTKEGADGFQIDSVYFPLVGGK